MIDQLLDMIQDGMIYFAVGLTAFCILALMLFDTVAGAGIMYYLTAGTWWAAVGISFATSGLLVMLMVLFYSNQESPVLFVATAAIFLLDVGFDSLSADVLRFGAYNNLQNVPDAGLHWAFRVLIGGLSTVGDAVAMALIVGMPIIKNVLHDALPKKKSVPPRVAVPLKQPPQGFTSQPQRYVPQHKPSANGGSQQPRREPTYPSPFMKNNKD